MRHFSTDLVEIWYRGLTLGANSKFEAISWIGGRYYIGIGYFL